MKTFTLDHPEELKDFLQDLVVKILSGELQVVYARNELDDSNKAIYMTIKRSVAQG